MMGESLTSVHVDWVRASERSSSCKKGRKRCVCVL